MENLREASSILRLKLPPDLRKKIFNRSLPNLANYSYYCAFLSVIKEKNPNVKVFHSGAELVSMAATRVGIETVYLHHGVTGKLSRASFPFYNQNYVYSVEEQSYIEDISPNSNVRVYPVKELSQLEKRVIIFLRAVDDDGTTGMSEENLSELITFFIKKDYQLMAISDDNYLGLMDDKKDLREDFELPEGELGVNIKNLYEKHGSAIVCTTQALGHEKITGFKIFKD